MQHHPFAHLVSQPTAFAVYAYNRREKVGGNLLCDPSGSQDDMCSFAIFQVNGDRVAFTTHSDGNTLKDSGLSDRAEFRLIRSIPTGETDHLGLTRINQNTVRVVLHQFAIDLLIGSDGFQRPFVEFDSAESFTHLGFGFPIDFDNRHSAALVHTNKVNIGVFSHHASEVTEVLSESGKRDRIGSERIYLKPVLTRLFWLPWFAGHCLPPRWYTSGRPQIELGVCGTGDKGCRKRKARHHRKLKNHSHARTRGKTFIHC